ncbi:ABC transporter ATP-binding protein [Micrococcus lylae]|uniref:ABC transporter ATP-binding protein n=1 Tax=Micrococcus lylae TaxID=1273 RepID=UPI000C80C3AA|nr:ABC transporter ATP-binding protein [Micrococcus lylae]WIK83292.1 ABC transporter ATP-binding protein [Micrococcus lylae]
MSSTQQTTQQTSAPETSAPDAAGSDLAVSAANVQKHFGKVRAVDGVDLTVPRGEVMALLGPNGAGKTTFLDMVLGFTRPSSGALEVFGGSPRPAVADGRVGAVLQTGALLEDLTVAQTLRYVAGCHRRHLPVADVVERAGLGRIASRKVKKCSGGEKQRLRFGLALLTDPELLILDEPTAGMDVAARADFWDAMHAEADRGRTVVFATHYLQEAADFADRIVLMRSGRIHTSGTVHELTAGAPRTVSCTWAGPGSPAEVAGRFGALLPDAGSRASGERVAFSVADGADASDRLVAALLTEGLGRDVEVERATLDRVFLDLTA